MTKPRHKRAVIAVTRATADSQAENEELVNPLQIAAIASQRRINSTHRSRDLTEARGADLS